MKFKRIIIDRKASGDLVTERIRNRLLDLPAETVDNVSRLIMENPAKDHSLVLMRHEGKFVKDFPVTPGAPPCREKYIITMLNCPFMCTYCYLQSYLDHGRIVVFTNTRKMKNDIAATLATPGTKRITTGEMGDSLALDHLTGITLDLLPLFSNTTTLLDVRTKSARVDHIIEALGNRPGERGKLIITWTLAPAEAITGEEPLTASLDERLDAMARAAAAGIRVGIRFDPVISWYYRKERYEALLGLIADSIGRGGVYRFEIGVLRFPPGLWEQVRNRSISSPLFRGEYFKDREGKMRLYKPERIKIYRDIYRSIQSYFPNAPVELSMEDIQVWEDAGILFNS